VVLPGVPAGAKPDLQPTAAEPVERGHLLGEDRGVSQVDAEHQRPDAQTGRRRRDGRQGGNGREPLEEVIREQQGGIAPRLDLAGVLDQAGEVDAVAEADGEAEGASRRQGRQYRSPLTVGSTSRRGVPFTSPMCRFRPRGQAAGPVPGRPLGAPPNLLDVVVDPPCWPASHLSEADREPERDTYPWPATYRATCIGMHVPFCKTRTVSRSLVLPGVQADCARLTVIFIRWDRGARCSRSRARRSGGEARQGRDRPWASRRRHTCILLLVAGTAPERSRHRLPPTAGETGCGVTPAGYAPRLVFSAPVLHAYGSAHWATRALGAT
jgi:hypothetical protein